MSRSSWAVRVFGSPAPKGSMKCVGGRGRHQLVNSNPATQPWQDTVRDAVHLWKIPEPIEGPVELQLTVTVARPASIKPAARPWPHKKAARVADGGGDVDKLARTVMDALEAGGVLGNDAQVCRLYTVKCYPDCVDELDVLPRPGAVVRLTLI